VKLVPFAPTEPVEASGGPEHAMVSQLQRSEIFRDYQQAFEHTTGLPLALRPARSFQPPLHGSKRVNSFCALMVRNHPSCAACLQLQRRLEVAATHGPQTLECFAGLAESAVPVRVGETLLGYLQTGQVFVRPPTLRRFREVMRRVEGPGTGAAIEELKTAYFQTRIVAKSQYESVVRLLAIFAQHLAAVSNQLMVSEATAEPPVIAKARAFIAAHQGEELHLRDVARAVSMSEFYFCKLFKQGTGLTFTGYLARVRTETVKALLLNTHTRVTEAAFGAGFQSLSQFNRVFRRIAGESPSVFRDRLHGHSPPLIPSTP
jgi:AraC-like DNA-binding protein